MKNFLIFVGGAVFGSIVTLVITHLVSANNKILGEDPVDFEVDDEFKRVKHETVENEAKIRPSEAPRRPYSGVSKMVMDISSSEEEKLAEDEFPRDEDPDEFDEKQFKIDGEMELASKVNQKLTYLRPKIIQFEDIENLPPGWTEEDVYYYVGNDALADNMDNYIINDERETMLTNDLLCDGIFDNDQIPNTPDLTPRYIANFSLMKVYEVHRVLGRYIRHGED